ncbi:hypothetical protein SAMN04487783_1706 [Agrococcus baldri]|uniref:Membrane protein DedA, SNARE-associated domain n=1 Tax=Agrococcus baldri TaxID=153730 RepID=A0AA94KZS7_9MICO|nr:hypothetical protein [Agrococcus baldri]SFS13814.1 hypothetical protein SAMN04487783_1706 [Agrococcus baldri]
MLEALSDFAAGLPAWAQWIGIMLISAIPFVESYFGAAIGVLVGLHPVVAIVAAIAGNAVSMLGFVFAADAARAKVLHGRGEARAELSPRRARLKRMFDRFGVPGVSLLGQTVLPSQITSGAMVSFGASRNAVILWQCISIVVWGVAFGLLALGGVELLALR